MIYLLALLVLFLKYYAGCFKYNVSNDITSLDYNRVNRRLLIGHDNHLVTYLTQNLTPIATFQVGDDEFSNEDYYGYELTVENRVNYAKFFQNVGSSEAVLLYLEDGSCKVLYLSTRSISNIDGTVAAYPHPSYVFGAIRNSTTYLIFGSNVDNTKRVQKYEDNFFFSIHRLLQSKISFEYVSNLVARYKLYSNSVLKIMSGLTIGESAFFVVSYENKLFGHHQSHCVLVVNISHPENAKLIEIPLQLEDNLKKIASSSYHACPGEDMLYLIGKQNSLTFKIYQVSINSLETKAIKAYKECTENENGFTPDWIELEGHNVCRYMVSRESDR